MAKYSCDDHSGIPEVRSGLKSPLSPPPNASNTRSSPPDNNRPDRNGEATHAIAGECERLFCDVLSAIFLGERNMARQESLVMDAYQPSRLDYTSRQDRKNRVQKWIELWDYAGDTIYRGFVTNMGNKQTLFVFFEDGVFAHGLKSGLMALFELASMPFECSQIVACVRRLQDATELDVARSLGWCGFNLTTLEPFNISGDQGPSLSNQWLFLMAEV